MAAIVKSDQRGGGRFLQLTVESQESNPERMNQSQAPPIAANIRPKSI